MKKIIAILPKSPFPYGRLEPIMKQDWVKSCLKAIYIFKQDPRNSVIVTTSSFHPKKSEREQFYYNQMINNLGYEITSLGKGDHTVSQLRYLSAYAKSDDSKLIVIVTWIHYLRVKYICRNEGIKVDLVVCGGIPRPKELFTDTIGFVIYPLICLLGYKERFWKKVQSRRRKGIL